MADVSKNRGTKTPKMDGENHEKPYEQMDDLGVPLLLETPILKKKTVSWKNKKSLPFMCFTHVYKIS